MFFSSKISLRPLCGLKPISTHRSIRFTYTHGISRPFSSNQISYRNGMITIGESSWKKSGKSNNSSIETLHDHHQPNRIKIYDKLLKAKELKDIRQFNKLLLSLTYTNNNQSHSMNRRVYPLLVSMFDETLATEDLLDWLYAMSKLSFTVDFYPHKKLCYEIFEKLLMNEIIHQRLLVKQTYKLIYGIGHIGFNWYQLHQSMKQVILRALEVTLSPNQTEEQLDRIQYRHIPSNIRQQLEAGLAARVSQLEEYGLSMAIYSLGIMKCDWSILPPKLKKGLVNGLIEHIDDMNPQSVSMTVYGLGMLGISFASIGKSFQQTLQDNIKSAFSLSPTGDDISGQVIANIIFGIALTKDIQSMDKELIEMMFGSVSSFQTVFNGQEIGSIVNSFHQMGYTSKTIPVECQQSLEMAIRRVYQSFDSCYYEAGQSIASLLYSLAKCQFQWESLSKETRDSLSVGLEVLHCKMSDQEFANAVYGLARLGGTVRDLSQETMKCLFDGIERLYQPSESSTSSSQSLATVIYSLGEIGCVWSELSESVRTVLSGQICRQTADSAVDITINEIELSNIFYGLSSMSVTWKELPAELQESLLSRLMDVFPSVCSDQAVANICHSLSRMNVPIDEKLSDAIISAVINVSDRLTPIGLSQTIYSLGCLGIPWTTTELQSLLLSQRFIKLFRVEADWKSHNLNGHILSQMIYGLARSGLQWIEMDNSVRLHLMNGIVFLTDSFLPQELSNIIYGLGKMGLTANMMTYKSRVALSRAIVRLYQLPRRDDCPQHIANVVYGMGLSRYKWKELHPTTVTALSTAIISQEERCSGQERASLLFGLSQMSCYWINLSEPLKRSLTNLCDRLFSTESTAAAASVTAGYVSQAVYALGKMRYSWRDLRQPQLVLEVLREKMSSMTSQELSNTIYGLSCMNLPSQEFMTLIPSLAQGVTDRSNEFLMQGIANTMFGVALLGADHLYPANLPDKGTLTLHTALCRSLGQLLSSSSSSPSSSPSLSSLDRVQLSTYYSLLHSTSWGREISEGYDGIIPSSSYQSPVIPSVIPSEYQSILDELLPSLRDGHGNGIVSVTSYQLDCYTPHGTVHAALYHNDRIIAFIEVIHSKISAESRVRKQIFRSHFPQLPYLFIRQRQFETEGIQNIARNIAPFLSKR